jgi:hypothetical protein
VGLGNSPTSERIRIEPGEVPGLCCLVFFLSFGEWNLVVLLFRFTNSAGGGFDVTISGVAPAVRIGAVAVGVGKGVSSEIWTGCGNKLTGPRDNLGMAGVIRTLAIKTQKTNPSTAPAITKNSLKSHQRLFCGSKNTGYLVLFFMEILIDGSNQDYRHG